MAEITFEDARVIHTAMEVHRSMSAAAKALGISKDRVFRAMKKYPLGSAPETPALQFPAFVTQGDEEEPIQDILDRFRRAHERRVQAIQERSWFPIHVNEDKPYALLWFGDPHLGPHTDWKLLERHISIAQSPGIYGANIGDTTDAWPWTGRLAKLWAENDISHKTERRLATWFMMDSGVEWLIWLGGNHDAFNGETEFYKLIGANRVPVIDWRAQFRLIHKSKAETRIDAAHGRKGSSIYNPTHGTLREAKFGEHADLWVTGHTHNFGLFDIEYAERKTHTWLAQISGYKMDDRYALVNGFPQANRGAAVLSIIYPDTGKVQCFADVEEGSEYLKYLRK